MNRMSTSHILMGSLKKRFRILESSGITVISFPKPEYYLPDGEGGLISVSAEEYNNYYKKGKNDD